MKKLLVALVFVASIACATEPAAIVTSAEPLTGAIDSLFDAVITQYVPGYGLQINARWIGSYELEDYIDRITGIVVGLAPTIKALQPNDYVSVAFSLRGFGGPIEYGLVRIQPSQPDSLEVWVNGAQR